MTYFCSNCWKEIKEDERICPRCKANQQKLDEEPFVQKLIRALNSAEPQTPIRAAYIIQMRKFTEAVPALLEKLKKSDDPFIIEAIINALLEIDEKKFKTCILKAAGENPPLTVKRALKKMERLKNE